MLRPLVFASLGVLACAHVPRGHGLTDPATAEVVAADRAFDQATATRGLAGFREFLSDDVVLFPANQDFVRGAEEAVAQWSELLQNPALTLRWAPENAERSGDLAYTFGYYELTTRGPDGVTHKRGKYVTIWRRGADGRWKVAVDGGTAGPNR